MSGAAAADPGRRQPPVLLGEAYGPSAPEDPAERRPCVDGAFKRLARHAGAETRIQELRFYAAFERRNLLDRAMGRQEGGGKGCRFPRREAREAAAALRPELEGRFVLLCGKRLARAFGLHDPRYFEPAPEGPGRACRVIPHPSGIVRWWNDSQNRERARRFLARVIRRECRPAARRVLS